jgi:hypothetical protein
MRKLRVSGDQDIRECVFSTLAWGEWPSVSLP